MGQPKSSANRADTSRWTSGQPSLQEGALGRVLGQAQRANQGEAGIGIMTEVAEQFRPSRVKQVIVVEGSRQCLYVLERRLRAVEGASGDGPVQPGNGRRREGHEGVVKQDDLTPVGLLPGSRRGVARGDGGLQLVRPWPPPLGRSLQKRYPGSDPLPVPATAILVLTASGRRTHQTSNRRGRGANASVPAGR